MKFLKFCLPALALFCLGACSDSKGDDEPDDPDASLIGVWQNNSVTMAFNRGGTLCGTIGNNWFTGFYTLHNEDTDNLNMDYKLTYSTQAEENVTAVPYSIKGNNLTMALDGAERKVTKKNEYDKEQLMGKWKAENYDGSLFYAIEFRANNVAAIRNTSADAEYSEQNEWMTGNGWLYVYRNTNIDKQDYVYGGWYIADNKLTFICRAHNGSKQWARYTFKKN